MPLIVNRPGHPAEDVLTTLSVQTDGMAFELAQTAQQALMAHTPNRWKGYLFRAVGVIAKIPDGYGVGGPVGPGEVLPEMEGASRGTIRDFLQEFPQYRTGLRGQGRERAWWMLPYAGKVKLKEERMNGRFGGFPPRAPYWLIAEYGSVAGISAVNTGVPAIEYIRKTRPIVAAREQQLRRTLGP